MASPRLFQDLRAALACLYSLSPCDGTNINSVDQANAHSRRRAHDFLLHLQSRNVRRKLHSIRQSNRDQKKPSNAVDKSAWLADEVEGSTWLACSALLSCVAQVDSAERLFAAQTLMHRVRRAKLSEAIDLEMEDPNKYFTTTSTPADQLNVNLQALATDYAGWMQHFHPLLGKLIVPLFMTHDCAAKDEEELKGQMAMLTLAAITYLTASHSQPEDANVQPLLVTLGSTLAAIALRLRFTPSSIHASTGNKATLSSSPLVTMIVHSLSAAASNGSIHHPNPKPNAALVSCLCCCLGAVPEAIVSSGGGGGVMGRISIDPRCIQAAHDELRLPTTGIYLLWEALNPTAWNEQDLTSIAEVHLLATWQRWARCLPLPQDFVEWTVPVASQFLLLTTCQPQQQTAALSYLIAIFESGSWTAQYILTFSLGLTSEQLTASSQPANRKRQSSRSKRRQQERIDTSATSELRVQAEAECRHRGDMACRTVSLSWKGLAATVQASLAHSGSVDGEGPLGCICACANACLPHWLRHSSSLSSEDAALALSIMELLQRISSHGDRAVRALSYEPLYSLNTALLETAQVRHKQVTPQPPSEMEELIANHLFQCTMGLATSCGYPTDYFDQLDQDNDEEMEVERNDVRDLIRAACGCDDSGTSVPMDVSMQVLNRLVQTCAESCKVGSALPPETAVHALSALAKPLNILAAAYAHGYRHEGICKILTIPILALGGVHSSVIVAFEAPAAFKDIFPVSRLANLATAAYAPALSALCKLEVSSSESGRSMSRVARETVAAAVQSAALSIVHIPELISESTLDRTQYDIRGAMRGPGGEDHVGILALMRLAFESNELARVMIASDNGTTSTSLALELCKLHENLKTIENKRGSGVFHGKGVAPKSRRILVQTLCHVTLLDDKARNSREALSALNNMFLSLIVSIAELMTPEASIDAVRVCRICEGVLDLAAFSPSMVCQVFKEGDDERNAIRQLFLCGVIRTCQLGYSYRPADSAPDDYTLQWGRLRGALVSFLRSSASPHIPDSAREAIVHLNNSECQSILSQFALGPSVPSPIYNESIISQDSIPSGIFVFLLGDIIEHQDENGGRQSARDGCIAALHELRTVVLETILLECGEPVGFADPRPTLCEAWYLSLNQLISSFGSELHLARDDSSTKTLLADSCCTSLLLLLYTSNEKDDSKSPANLRGMSLDGPQTRAMLDFLQSFFLLGPEMFHEVSISLGRKLCIDVESTRGICDAAEIPGIAVIGASLFRAASGGLPPWAIEFIPTLYSSLFVATGQDPNVFCQMLELAMDVRLSTGFGRICRGQVIAGRFFEHAKMSSRAMFIEKSREYCRINNGEGWRRFKVLLKQACGGKKKSSLSLKPSFTVWDVDRI